MSLWPMPPHKFKARRPVAYDEAKSSFQVNILNIQILGDTPSKYNQNTDSVYINIYINLTINN